jgi:hypothetical protein
MTAATDTAAGSGLVGPAQVEAFQRDGAICLRGVFKQWIAPLQRGVEVNMTEPGDYGSENTTPGEPGRFFDDYCNWQRISEFKRFVLDSDAARIAAEVMGSRTAQFFHDHVLVKEPGTCKRTPWHQDIPYYCVDGRQTVSFWMPLDPVPRETSLRIVKGSHRWDKLVRPVAWLTDADFYQADDDYMDLPDVDGQPERYEILSWALQPGDAVLFSTAPRAIRPESAGAPFRTAGWATTCVSSNAAAGPRRPTRESARRPASGCARTGSRSSGHAMAPQPGESAGTIRILFFRECAFSSSHRIVRAAGRLASLLFSCRHLAVVAI